jgi:YVTN family beta-propeller protein
VQVGLEPVAVAARNASEVWVVNHLSDSVSIVDVATSPPRVVRTLLTCDEPRDIVFAGPGGNRAFITTARRGQNCPVSADLTIEGTGRALVQVFDATNLGTSLGGTPLTNVVLFGDTPRALARSADGNTVYAAVFHSGNQTTALSEGLVCNGGAGAGSCSVFGFTMPGGLPAPNAADGEVGPEVGLIVRFNEAAGQWQDELGRNWNNAVRLSLPDQDVFAINAAGAPPAATATFTHVGTVLFNMAVNPVNGRVYVSNTEARNEVRFEGPGTVSSTVQGHLHEARITVINGASVSPRHLNKHIDYDVLPAPAGVKPNSLATPIGIAVTANGQTLYVAAFGSSKVGVFSTNELENDTFVPDDDDHIAVTGGGPTGLVLDEANGRLYVFTRFDNSISIIDTTTAEEVGHVPVYNPEPALIQNGRPFLYDASFTSSNGEASCSSCHVFADFDSLAWDLGDPDGQIATNPLPFRIPGDTEFHPLKGPMTTQSLRGMANHGAMHWRGDRNGGSGAGAFDEDAAFKAFNPAFVGLIGRTSQLSAADMQAFTNFILTVTYPPNPIRSLDNSLTASQQAGSNLYFGAISDTVFNCNGCHTLNRAQGFFGSDGFATFEGETQSFKVAHLRNAYQKVGMFGMPRVGGIEAGNNGDLGPQVRGFGYLHDGSIDTLFRFFSATVFSLSTQNQLDLEQFVLAFDTELFPAVGQQVTLTSTNAAVANPRINLLLARASTSPAQCDVVVKGNVAGEQRGAYLTSGVFQTDRDGETATDAQIRALASTPGQEVTYTCVPPGSGERIGVDRDEDGFFDRDELDAGSDPADPTSIPGGGGDPIEVRTTSLTLRDDATPPINPNGRTLSFRSAKLGTSPSGVVVPAWTSAGDPTVSGATLTVYDGDGGAGTTVTVALPAIGWRRTGTATNPGYRYSDPQRFMGPITSVTLRAGTLAIRGKGPQLYALSNAPQGTMALRLELGGDTEMCAAAPAKTPTTSNDTTSKFVAARNTPPPVACPAVP